MSFEAASLTGTVGSDSAHQASVLGLCSNAPGNAPTWPGRRRGGNYVSLAVAWGALGAPVI